MVVIASDHQDKHLEIAAVNTPISHTEKGNDVIVILILLFDQFFSIKMLNKSLLLLSFLLPISFFGGSWTDCCQ